MSRKFTTRLAALLCTPAVLFAAAACVSDENNATSPSESQDSASEAKTVASNGEGEGGGELASATGNKAVDLIGDQAFGELFGERFIQTRDVGDGFYIASHLSKNVRVIQPSNRTILQRDPRRTGYVKTDEGDAYSYVEVNVAKDCSLAYPLARNF
ncbi:hypothetical protein [Corynebacterium urogenitale]